MIIIDIKQFVPTDDIIICIKLLSHSSRDAWIKGLIMDFLTSSEKCRIPRGMRGLKELSMENASKQYSVAFHTECRGLNPPS